MAGGVMKSVKKTGKILGMPYDFRRPTLARIRERIWNPDDPRLIVPRVFGMGWTVNLASLRKRSLAGFYLVLAAYVLIGIKVVRETSRTLRGGKKS